MSANHSDLAILLSNMIAELQVLKVSRNVTTAQDTVRRFMGNLYQLGLAVHRDPSLRTSPAVTAFLHDSAQFLPYAMSAIEHFITLFQEKFYGIWEGDWRLACERRSSIQFLFELYQDTSFGEFLPDFDLDELNRVMRERGYHDGYIAPGTVPQGIPDTHWWWCPEKLPPPENDE